MPNIVLKQCLSRRAFLRGTGVALTLPWLEAMVPAFARVVGAHSDAEPPRRFVSVSQALGFHAPHLNPEEAGRGYRPSKYLQPLGDILGDLTVISGASHPDVGGGHKAEACILSAAPMTAGNFRNTISVDQLMAKHLGDRTRYPSLVLNSTSDSSPSYVENGSMIPAENSPSRLFAKLFIDETPAARTEQSRRLKQGRSIMDIVSGEARAMQRRVGEGDRDKLDAYFSSVRDLERRLAANEAWVERPKPRVDARPPAPVTNPSDLVAHERAMLDVMHLALQTDSTRFMTLHMNGGGGVLPIEGVSEGYHQLSHHGLDPDKITQLGLVEQALVNAWADFVRKLKQSPEAGGNVLDRTMVLLTSNLGNASSHDNKNMPVLFAGGGFRHGQHLAFDRKNNYPLPNLYLSAIQRLGLEIDRFASSTGPLRGLDMA